MDFLRAHILVVCLILAGVAIGITVGLRHLIGNCLTGAVLRGRQIRRGDIIEFSDGCAWIERFGTTSVTLQTWDKCHHIIPYRDFLGGLWRSTAYSKQSFTVRIPVKCGNPHNGQRGTLPRDVIAAQLNSVLGESPALGIVENADPQGVTLRIRAWINDPEDGLTKVRSQLLNGILERLDAAGIPVPIAVESDWSLN